jgi:hypothetical protein
MIGILTTVLLLHHFGLKTRKPPVLYVWLTKFTIPYQLAVRPLIFRTSLRAYKHTNVGTLTLFRNIFPSPQIESKISRYSLKHPLTYIIFWVFLLVWVCVDVRKYDVFSSTRTLAFASLHSDGWRHTLWRTVTRVALKRGTSPRRAEDINWFIPADDGPRSVVPSSALEDSLYSRITLTIR